MEYAENKQTSEITAFPQEEVYLEIVSGSMVFEVNDILKRQTVKDSQGVFPDEAKLNQALCPSGTRGPGSDIIGLVVRQAVQQSLPQLGMDASSSSASSSGDHVHWPFPPDAEKIVTYTDRKVVRKVPLLQKHQHRYRKQAEDVWAHEAEQQMKCMGQSWGNRYKPKKKALKPYTRLEVMKTISKHKGTPWPPALGKSAQLPAGHTSPLEGHTEALDHGAPQGLVAITGTSLTSPFAGSPAPQGQSRRALMDGDVADDTTDRPAGAPTSIVAYSAGVAFESQRRAAEDAETPEVILYEDENTARTKSPQQWTKDLQLEDVWKGRPLTRFIQQAEACVGRSIVESKGSDKKPQNQQLQIAVPCTVL